MDTIHVLDKGYVRLVDHMGSDLSIVRAARVSYDAAWRTGEDQGSDRKLINYLWKHRHTTPFEAATLTFEVKAPIFVFRQWHRHRTQSYNEVSARYTELTDEFYVPKAEEIGVQSKSSKQSRNITGGHLEGCDWYKLDLENEHHDCTCGFIIVENSIEEVYYDHCAEAFDKYQNLLKIGWPRELARMVLPLSTYSKMQTTLNLRNLFHFLELRLHEHAQYEIRVYAAAMLELTKEHYPTCVEAFNGNC